MTEQEVQITYNKEASLTVPSGGVLAAILVSVTVEPADAGCLIYGWQPDGKLGCVEVMGSQERVELPFAHPQVFLKYIGALESIQIHTLGWQEDRTQM